MMAAGVDNMTADQHAEIGTERFTVRATADSNFAWLRTRLALENTLMAWVRTAISLIGFGFAVVEIFNRLAAMPTVAPAAWPDAPRYVGLALIGAGILGLLISCWQYVWINRYLWSPQFGPIAGLRDGPMGTPSLVIAIALTVIGLLAFFAVLLRVT
jgi:putative membrane protein